LMGLSPFAPRTCVLPNRRHTFAESLCRNRHRDLSRTADRSRESGVRIAGPRRRRSYTTSHDRDRRSRPSHTESPNQSQKGTSRRLEDIGRRTAEPWDEGGICRSLNGIAPIGDSLTKPALLQHGTESVGHFDCDPLTPNGQSI